MSTYISKNQIDGNLRRTAELQLISKLSVEELNLFAKKYYWNDEHNCYICPYTGKLIKDYNDLVLEHIIPVSSRGGTVLFNCVPAHKSINGTDQKGAKHLLDWWIDTEYFTPERLETLVNYMLDAYNQVFTTYTEEEILNSYEEFYNDEKFGKVPVEWEVKRIDDISERITDVIDPTKTKEVYDYIGLEHIVPDKFIRCGKGYSNETVALKVKFEKGDLLYGKLRPYLNKVFISDISGVGSTEFIVLRNNKFTNWVYLNFQLQRFLDYTKSMTAGTQHPRASWKDIKHYQVCVPKNEIERKMIEERILSLEKYRFSQQELVITHEHLKKSLMQNLLTGKIKVRE